MCTLTPFCETKGKIEVMTYHIFCLRCHKIELHLYTYMHFINHHIKVFEFFFLFLDIGVMFFKVSQARIKERGRRERRKVKGKKS